MKITRKTFDECMFPCYNPQDFVIAKAKGVHVYDTQGKEYLDLTSGIGVNSLGHCPKIIEKTLKKQSRRLVHCSNVFTNDKTLELALALKAKTQYERFFFVNSGAEANEAALKLARRYAYDVAGEEKDEIIAFDHGFHGRTFFTVSVGGQEKYSSGFGPRPGAITHLPFNDVAALKAAVSSKTCAIMVEPVQGEGGVMPASAEFMQALRACADEVGALLIFDEVQTGNARTGTLYAYEQYGVRPDILTTAKGIGGGLPIGIIMTSTQIASHFGPGTHGSTFGGNPLICACAIEVLKVISSDKFLHGVQERAQLLHNLLEKVGEHTGMFSEVRGMGMLQGAILKPEYAGQAGDIMRFLAGYGVLVLTAGGNILRFAPALNIKKSTLKQAIKLLEQGLLSYKQVKQV